jgi:hypothetical protein
MNTHRMNDVIGRKDCRLHLRRLSASEVVADYLPLRYATLHREMQWAKQGTTSPSDLRDVYDGTALQFGIYLGTRILAAIRLILADRFDQLPSGVFFSDPFDASGRVAEASKAMVYPTARGCRLFTALLLECETQSLANGLTQLFISVIDTDRIRRFLQAEGFQMFGSPFRFEDQTISPEGPAVLFCNRLKSGEEFIRGIATRQDRILSQAQAKLEARVGT